MIELVRGLTPSNVPIKFRKIPIKTFSVIPQTSPERHTDGRTDGRTDARDDNNPSGPEGRGVKN